MSRHYPRRVSPFRNPRIKACLAAPRGLSQLATSFIASQHQGIHRLPLIAWPQNNKHNHAVLLYWRLISISKLSKSNSSIDNWRLSIDDCWFRIDLIFIISIVNPQSTIFNQSGGGERTRTDGLLRAKQALSQLSYTPKKYCGFWIADFGFYIQQSKIENLKSKFGMVGLDGVEPSTSRLSGVRSNQTELQAHTNAEVCIRISESKLFPTSEFRIRFGLSYP